MTDDTSDDPMDDDGSDEAIVRKAKKRFQRCVAWESDVRDLFQEDMKFAYGDPDNKWQWPDEQWLSTGSGGDGGKPRLTVNKVRQHNLQIKNDGKQNKPGVNIRPTGGEATFEAAQTFEGCVRSIEKNSRAEQAYDTAFGFSVDAGIGYCRLITDYISDDSFDQDIFIRRIPDSLSTYLDPDIREIDGSDARFGFIFEDVPNEEFFDEHPELKGKVGSAALGDTGGWITKDHIRVAEYFYKTEKKDTLIAYIDEGGEQKVVRASKLSPVIAKALLADKMTKKREIRDQQITWCKIAGEKIISTRPWLGKYVPIARCVGEEVIIGHELHRAGHTRAMKDAQRMYNYWTSSAVEHVAYQTKTRWFVPVGATDNLEEYWQNMNLRTSSFIPYNAMTEQGEKIPEPTPIDPPVMADAYIKGMTIAQTELMMGSGQYQSQFGQNENATSGKAINERQRQGDNATYHFVDGLAIMIRHVGNMLIDLIPKVYDTPRILRILAEDGTESRVQLDPQAKLAHQVAEDAEVEKVSAIFNPNVGRYSVEADVGPSYATRRQEAWNAIVQILSQNQTLTMVIGDILFRNADFPGADEIAERLKRLTNPQALGEGPSPDQQAVMAQNENLKKLLADALEKMATADRKLADKEVEQNREAFDARTKRITAVSNAEPELGEDRIRPLVDQMIKDALTNAMPGGKGGGAEPAAGEGEAGPLPGARKAPDGRWYVGAPGAYFRVEEDA